MEILPLVAHINLVTDEDFDLKQVIGFCNDAISKINIEANALFPLIDETLKENNYKTEEYADIPDHWIRMLIVPYAAGRIKENDSSQFEYMDWYAQFDLNMKKFLDSYEIPEEFKGAEKTKFFEEDYSQHIYSPLKGW